MAEPTLYARMELRLNDFEKKLAKATKSTDTTMRKIEARGEQMTARMRGMGAGAFGGLIKGAALALAPILSVGAALNGARAALDKFSSIADNAAASGLDAERWQELAYAAEQGGVEFEAFSGALATFNKNAGLAAVGKGKMIAALKALNPELLASIQNATTQEQRVRLAADAIDKAGSASEKAALATAMFGDAGAKLANAFAGGTAAIDATAAAARKLGIIVDRDLIAKSEALGDELSTATQVMDLQFKQTLVELAPILIETAKLAGNLAAGINYITESMQALGQRGTARLEEDLAGLDDTLAKANATMGAGYVGTMGVEIDPAGQAKMKAERDAIYAELKRRAMDQLRIDLNRPKPTEGGGGGGDSSGDAAAKAAIKHAEAVKALIADLTFEKQILGETAIEQQILNTLRNAGVDSASAEGLAIRGLITDLDAQKSAIERNAEAMAAFGDMAQSAMGSFIDDMIEGKSLAESFGGILKSLGSQLINAGMSSLFKSGGVLGFADGGYTGPGGKNEPAGVVHKGEYVFTKAQTAKLGAGNLSMLAKGYANGGMVGSPGPVMSRAANDNTSVVINMPIDATGADAAGLARVEQAVVQLKSELPLRMRAEMKGRGKYWF
jgi:hypothetical protein